MNYLIGIIKNTKQLILIVKDKGFNYTFLLGVTTE